MIILVHTEVYQIKSMIGMPGNERLAVCHETTEAESASP
jgi:hypothetical protein